MRRGGAREYYLGSRIDDDIPPPNSDFFQAERIQEIMEQQIAASGGDPPQVDMIRDSLRFNVLQHPDPIRRWGFNTGQEQSRPDDGGRNGWRSLMRQQLSMQAEEQFFSRRKLKTKPKDEFMPRYEELLNRFDGPSSDNPFQSTFLQTQSYSKRLKDQNPPQEDTTRKLTDIYNYSLYETRLASFRRWPHRNYAPHYPEEMAMSGFYLQATAEAPDRCICYYCGKVLHQWQEADDPIADHLKHSPYCLYALKFKKICEAREKQAKEEQEVNAEESQSSQDSESSDEANFNGDAFLSEQKSRLTKLQYVKRMYLQKRRLQMILLSTLMQKNKAK